MPSPQSNDGDYPRKLSDSRWLVEVKGRDGMEVQVIDLPSGSIDQVGWDPMSEIEGRETTS